MTAAAQGTGPRRVLVLGNSHIAAVKNAHGQSAAPWPGLAVEFAGGQLETLAALEVQEGRLIPRTEAAGRNLQALNQRAEWALADYDAFVVVGCRVGINLAQVPYRKARFLGLPSGTGQGVEPPLAPVSRAMFELSVREGVAQSVGGTLALRLVAGLQPEERQGPAARVMVAEQPRPSFDCRRQPGKFSGLLQAHRVGDGLVLSDIFEGAALRALPGVTFLPQPEQTRHGGMFTLPRYSVGSVRLTAGESIAHPEDDFIHANAEYGALVLDQIAEALGPVA